MSTIFEVEVSIFSNYRATTPLTYSLDRFLFGEKPRSIYTNLVNEIRAEPSKEKRDTLKENLCAITPSALLKDSRSAKSIVSHSGFIQFDVDAAQNPTWDGFMPMLKEAVQDIPIVAYAGLSASANGIWGLCRIPPSADTHKLCFEAISIIMETHCGVVIDRAPSSVASMRSYTIDDMPYINLDAGILSTEYAERLIATHGDSREAKAGNSYSGDGRHRTEMLVKAIEAAQCDITYDYADWFQIGCALAGSYGEDGRDWFHRISSVSTKYNAVICDRKYTECIRSHKQGGKTVSTLFHIAKLNNITLL